MKADGSDQGYRQTSDVARRDNPQRGLKDILASDYVKGRFADVMGDKASAFIASILNAVRLNPSLSKCDPMTVVGSAMVAASLDLPIDASLGFSAIVPYNLKGGRMVAQFQIMTKGFVQLALRSGQYKTINVGPIYEDEFKGIDIISGDVEIVPVADGFRDQDRQDKVVGYVAFFRLLNGFEKIEYWPMKKILAHGKRFSKSYEKEYGLWKTDLPAMASKTVLKNMLSRWGILSTKMQSAMVVDQAAIADIDKPVDEAEVEYVDNADEEAEPEQEEKGPGAGGVSDGTAKTEKKAEPKPEAPAPKKAEEKPVEKAPTAAKQEGQAQAPGESDLDIF